ncbi:MAG TPA: hypothetical protein EYO58_07400 [Flavobacteriales bacterium]|nr:hypothetical protein [Flavobacteriales bacterium]
MPWNVILKLRQEKIKITDISKSDTLEDLIFLLKNEYFGNWMKEKKFLTDKFREIPYSANLLSIISHGKTKNKKISQKIHGNIVIYVRDTVV